MANPIPLANRTLRQLQSPGGFHLSEFGYRAREGATNLRRRALRRILDRGISMRYLVRRLKLLAIWNNSKPIISRRLRSDAVFVRQRLYPEEAENKQAAAAAAPDDGFDFGDDNDNGGGGDDAPPPPPAPPAPVGRGGGRGGLRGFRVGPYVLRARRQPARRSRRQQAARRGRANRRRGSGRGRGRGG